jgi:hypothetical protein
MRLRVSAAALALLLVWPFAALARDPFREERGSDPVPPADRPDPLPFIAPPPDLYYVTDTYVADVVTTSGPLTTYTTTTVHESTGSYARVLETVATGASSIYDGRAFNGRRSLGDGRLIAGTYYENYVLIDGAFVPVSIVFFQDDAELARLLPAPTPTQIVSPMPRVTSSADPMRSEPCCVPLPPQRALIPTAAPVKTVRPGISLIPAGAPLSSVEVLRGRRVGFFLRAFIDDREVPVRSWSVIGGDAGAALGTSGIGGVPFQTSWLRLAPPGAAYQVVFRIDVDTPEAGLRSVEAAIAVTVLSPALQE